MTQMGTKDSSERDIYKWNSSIQKMLADRFEKVAEEDGILWFAIEENAFRAVPFEKPFCGFIVEYAEGHSKTDLIGAEDVNQYPITDYDSPKELFEEILNDIS